MGGPTTNQINRERDFCRLPTKFPSVHLRWGKLLTFLFFGCVFFFSDIFQPAICYFTGGVDNTNVMLWVPDSPSSLQGKLSEAVDWFHMALSMSVRRGPQISGDMTTREGRTRWDLFFLLFVFLNFQFGRVFLAAQQNPLFFCVWFLLKGTSTTPQRFNSSPLKNDGWKTIRLPFGSR